MSSLTQNALHEDTMAMYQTIVTKMNSYNVSDQESIYTTRRMIYLQYVGMFFVFLYMIIYLIMVLAMINSDSLISWFVKIPLLILTAIFPFTYTLWLSFWKRFKTVFQPLIPLM